MADALFALLKQARRRAFWRELEPTITIRSSTRLASKIDAIVRPEDLDRAEAQLQQDGYFSLPPFISRQTVSGLRAAVARTRETGLPPTFALVHDEFYRMFGALFPIFDRTHAEPTRFVPDLYVWWVPVGNQYMGFAPHRDEPDRSMSECTGPTGAPNRQTAWVPLGDVTPESSCIYVVPKFRDSGYQPIARQPKVLPHLRDARAIPAAAGSVVSWGSHLLHWGSPSSPWASEPRVSVGAMYVSESRATPIDLERGTRLTFTLRLQIVARGLLLYHREPISDRAKDELVRMAGPLSPI